MRSHVFLLALALLAGCSDMPGARNHAGDLKLEDLQGCPLEFPDGKPVDCVSKAVTPASTLRPGMTCLERLPGASSTLTIWGNSDGEVDLEYQIRGDLSRAKSLGWIHVWLGDREVFASFVGASHGVLRPDFTGASSREFRGDFGLYTASSSGDPDFLDTLDVTVDRYEDSAWFSWLFHDGSAQFVANSMVQVNFDDGSHWLPYPLEAKGSDFDVKVNLTREMIANMANTLPEDSLLSPPSNRC